MAGTECPGTPGTDGWQRGAPEFKIRGYPEWEG